MDDDLVDVLIVLGVLAFGLIGLVILLALNVKRFRMFLQCCRKEKEEPIKPRKRTTIRVSSLYYGNKIIVKKFYQINSKKVVKK
ncbi:hypothetical protein OESDEN_24620 [Oesophagostomum dentatum]|uniref:Uncharacterized protein n=1 Tax=Oesophagostomum dentatum TaxID=61180 RepID=A0A0B1RSV9_OESDE|nr:hypothetical protein OESDEN_24620 [Oesophagostomum dentatum]